MPVDVDVDVLAAVNTLSVQQRASVVLTYWEDLTPAEVGSRLGICCFIEGYLKIP